MMTYYQERLLAIIEQADYRPLTKKAYRSDVRHLCRHVERIDVPSLQRYGKFLRDTYAPATAARRLHALSILFAQLVAERSLGANPLARVKKPIPAPYRRLAFTYDDVHRVLETIRDETVYAFSFLLLHTGLRFSEARDLQLADVDFARDQLLVRSGKGDQSRQVPLHHALRDVLTRYIETIRPDVLPLFCEDSGRPVNPAKFRRALKEASERCLGRILRPHDIRVTFATTLYHVHQTDILTIMRLLGHSDVRTTQHYVLPSHDIAHTSVNRLKRTDD